MSTNRARTLILHLVVASAFCFSSCSDSRRGIYPGEIAPDVTGVDVNGAPLTLHSINGSVVLVNFWATWCGPCMAELPALQSLHDTLHSKGFSVVGVAVNDSLENIKDAIAKNKITYPVLIDEAGKSKRAFEIAGMPESFVLDAERRVVVVMDPYDGSPVTKIIGARDWNQNQALQVFKALVQ